jgi:endonuclease YncB( thermonuclease family)
MISDICTKKLISFFVFILLFMAQTSFAAKFLVVNVKDGDTIKVLKMDNKITVRLVGIDAPETSKRISKYKGIKGQPFSKEAKNYLISLVLDKFIDIKFYGQNQDGEKLGVISYGLMNVNLKMIEAGFAEVYQGKMPSGFNAAPYWKAEKEARKNKRGMWSQGEKYKSPKDWRSGERNN